MNGVGITAYIINTVKPMLILIMPSVDSFLHTWDGFFVANTQP